MWLICNSSAPPARNSCAKLWHIKEKTEEKMIRLKLFLLGVSLAVEFVCIKIMQLEF